MRVRLANKLRRKIKDWTLERSVGQRGRVLSRGLNGDQEKKKGFAASEEAGIFLRRKKGGSVVGRFRIFRPDAADVLTTTHSQGILVRTAYCQLPTVEGEEGGREGVWSGSHQTDQGNFFLSQEQLAAAGVRSAPRSRRRVLILPWTEADATAKLLSLILCSHDASPQSPLRSHQSARDYCLNSEGSIQGWGISTGYSFTYQRLDQQVGLLTLSLKGRSRLPAAEIPLSPPSM